MTVGREVVRAYLAQGALERAADGAAPRGDDDGLRHATPLRSRAPEPRGRLAAASGRSPRVVEVRRLGYGGPRASGRGGAAAPSGPTGRARGRRPAPRRPRCRPSRTPRPPRPRRRARPRRGARRAPPRRSAPASSRAPRTPTAAAPPPPRGSPRRRGGSRPGRTSRFGSAANSGPEEVAERHGATAGLDDGDGLRGGELSGSRCARPSAAAGRWARSSRGRGRCPRRPPRRRRASRRTASTSSRTDVDGRTRWVTSLAPTMMTASCGRALERPGRPGARGRRDCAPVRATLCSRTGRRRLAARPAPSTAPGVSSGRSHAEAGGAGVAEHGERQRLAGRSPYDAPYSPSARGGCSGGLADAAPRELRLRGERAEEARAEHSEAAAAVRRRHGDPPRPSCPAHAACPRFSPLLSRLTRLRAACVPDRARTPPV